jgi:hypothetical protein
MIDRHYSLNLKPWSARTLYVYAHADLAQKYSVGLQEIFVSRLCSQEENDFFLPWLNPSLSQSFSVALVNKRLCSQFIPVCIAKKLSTIYEVRHSSTLSQIVSYTSPYNQKFGIMRRFSNRQFPL